MKDSIESPFIIPENTSEKWTRLGNTERETIFAEAYRAALNHPQAGEEIIKMKAEEYATAPLESCFFPEFPNFQQDLCKAIEAFEEKE
jgi:hypothetical protein